MRSLPALSQVAPAEVKDPAVNGRSRLTLTNRLENQKLLLDFIQRWARQRGLPRSRLNSLELAASRIFHHLVDRAHQPHEPGSITVELSEKGARLRLMFEDDAVPPAAPGPAPTDPGAGEPPYQAPPISRLQALAESLIYYRTAAGKNRLVVFLS